MNSEDLKYRQDTHNIWFPDQREPIYDPTDPKKLAAFKKYWNQEKERMIYGFHIADGQVFVSGWLYWHTVYWKIAKYEEIGEGAKKRKVRIVGTPDLRDIDWEIAGDMERALDEGRFYMLVGSRDFGKSVVAGSRAGWTYTLFKKSEVVISGGETTYMKLLTDKIEDGLTHLHPYLKRIRVKNDWAKEVRSGFKDKSTNQVSEKSWDSAIIMRNYEMGNKTMAANGTRPSFHVIDEIGTIPNFISCVKDSDGCWWSGGGDKPSCLPMFIGTGGDMEKGKEAGDMFNRPGGYNLLEFDNEWEDIPRKIGKFMPATKSRNKFREPTTLATYLNIEHPDLDNITILVSNQVKAYEEWWLPEYNKALRSGNPKAILKFKAYWPLVPSDSFLILSNNDYNVEAAKKQRTRLLSQNTTGTAVIIHHDEKGKLIHRLVGPKDNMHVITEYPCTTQNTNAPVVIWEFPMESPPWGLYVAGIDPYEHDQAENSESLGAVYIYKRIHDIQSETYQEMFVAAYVARPGRFEEWAQNAINLVRYYNAIALVENDDMNFIRWCTLKGYGHYLADQPAWLKEIVPFTTVSRDKGVHRSSDRVRNYFHSVLKEYLDDVLVRSVDPDTGEETEILGVHKVMDPVLLEELIKFNKKEGNFDREVAASLAVAMARHLDPQVKVEDITEDKRFEEYFRGIKKRPRKSVFSYHSKPVFSRNNRLL